jgi:hypothetical protein
MVIYITAPPNKKPKKSSAASIPSRHIFTSCRVVASRHTRFVCLFICLFVPLVCCCIISLPLVVTSRPVSSVRHVVALHLVSRLCLAVVESLRRRISSRLVVVSRPLMHLISPALFDCCIYCRHRAAAATVAVPPPPCRAVLLPPPPRRRALSLSHTRVVVVVVVVVFVIVIVILLS